MTSEVNGKVQVRWSREGRK